MNHAVQYAPVLIQMRDNQRLLPCFRRPAGIVADKMCIRDRNIGVSLSDNLSPLLYDGWDGKSLTKSGNGTLILSATNN